MAVHWIDPENRKTREVPSAVETTQGLTECGRWASEVQVTAVLAYVDCKRCLPAVRRAQERPPGVPISPGGV